MAEEYMTTLSKPSTQTLDAVLSFQFLVGWAGEGLSEPKRLDWWRTDLVDQGGGGDLLHRLLPKTHEWAAFCAVRQAAIQVDRQQRQEVANSDAVRTLFFWGFEINEALSDRLADHKRLGQSVSEVLALPMDLAAKFSADAFADTVRIPGQVAEFKVVPGGRELAGNMPESLELRAQKLVAALVPLAESYPMPFYRVEG
jgi:hypothetical protein